MISDLQMDMSSLIIQVMWKIFFTQLLFPPTVLAEMWLSTKPPYSIQYV